MADNLLAPDGQFRGIKREFESADHFANVQTLTFASYDARHAWSRGSTSIEHVVIEHVDLVHELQISMAYVLLKYKISLQMFPVLYATCRFVTAFTASLHWLLF
jgi:hypothetical protein